MPISVPAAFTTDDPATQPVLKMIATFNGAASNSELGREQPRLTDTELKAVIRWGLATNKRLGTTSAERRQLLQLLEQNRSPIGWRLEASEARRASDGSKFRVWRIVLKMPRGEADGVPLAAAIAEFNARYAGHMIGENQSEPTEDEVVAAIRLWRNVEMKHQSPIASLLLFSTSPIVASFRWVSNSS